MPSARDLLQQADALMRSHRNVGSTRGAETVPVLTDVAIPGSAGVVTRQRVEEIPVLTNVVAEPTQPVFDLTIPSDRAPEQNRFPPTQPDPLLLPLSEMPPMPPQINDEDSVIGRDKADSRAERPTDSPHFDDDVPKWLEADLLDTDVAGVSRTEADVAPRASARIEWEAMPMPSVDALATQEPPVPQIDAPSSREVFEADRMPAGGEPAISDTAESSAEAEQESDLQPHHGSRPRAELEPGAEAEPLAATQEPAKQASPTPSAEELAETVYFQVLQNLDLYTERALQQHMTAHLSPIIEQATQELLATLNANLGALIRQFVADAIEKQLGVRPGATGPAAEA